MKTTIVTGMLGAGKTTFIKNYLRKTKERAVVLVNDFGKAGIDGEIIKQEQANTIELPSGCVCCTLKADLEHSIRKAVQELSPEHLLIEPSGVASVSAVMEALEGSGISSFTVVCIVDPVDFLDIYSSQMYGTFFEDQIRSADVVMVNKTDIAEAESINGTIKVVDSMNPSAIILKTVRGEIYDPLPEGRQKHSPFPVQHTLRVESLSLRLKDTVDFSQVLSLFNELKDGNMGRVLRAKALVRTADGNFRFDLVTHRLTFEVFPSEISYSRVVVIGTDLQRDALAEWGRLL